MQVALMHLNEINETSTYASLRIFNLSVDEFGPHFVCICSNLYETPVVIKQVVELAEIQHNLFDNTSYETR